MKLWGGNEGSHGMAFSGERKDRISNGNVERTMTVGLGKLRHIVVLMMENRSFDHMLGGISLVIEGGQKKYPKINGLTGNEANPDSAGNMVKVQANAKYQGQLDHDPDHHFQGVDLQIFGTLPAPGRLENM